MLVVATGNMGKMNEIRRILPSYSFVTMQEAGFLEEIEENGETFEENALIKARAVCRATGKAAVADDSGLTVDAIGGSPGIYPARFAGEHATDPERVEKLLTELKNVPEEKRGAAFVSVIAYVSPEGEEKTFRGECRGVISTAPAGANGFGYDPVFFVPELGKTFAEMEAEEKHAISHRGRALALFKTFMETK